MPEPERHESQPTAEDTGPADLRAVRDRAEVVAATVHGRGITRDDGCPACVLARRDVPALLDELDDLWFTLSRIFEGSVPTAEERALACGPGGLLADLAEAGLVPPGFQVIAAAVLPRLRAMRASHRPPESGPGEVADADLEAAMYEAAKVQQAGGGPSEWFRAALREDRARREGR